MNKLFLWLTRLAAPLWTKLGADPRALHLILDVKLKISARNPVVMGRQMDNKGNYAWLIYLVLGFFGLALIALYFLLDHTPTVVGVVFTVGSIYLCLMLVMEMSENMFDLRDLTVLLSRPISDQTFSLSRALHIGVFAAKFALLLYTPLFVTLIIGEGPLLALLYAVLATMSIVISVTFTLGVYLTMIKYVPTERLRRVLGYLQMFLTTVFFFAYQLPSLFTFLDVTPESFVITGSWRGFVWPGFWLSGIYGLLSGFTGPLFLAQGVLGVAATIGGVAYYVSQGKGYGERLMALQVAGSQPKEQAQSTGSEVAGFRHRYREWVAQNFTRPGLERASLRFNWAIMSRDMKYKQQVYPMLVVLPIMVAFIFGQSLLAQADAFSGGGMIATLYAFALLIVSPLTAGRQSEAYRAAWIFESNPLPNKKAVLYGQYVTALGQFLVPAIVLLYAAVIALAGPHILDDIVLSTAGLLTAALMYQQMDSTLPFSTERTSGSYNSLGPMLAVLFLASVFGGLHYLLSFVRYAIPIAALTMWGLYFVVLAETRGEKPAPAPRRPTSTLS